jgi:hypothetical protein
MTWLEREYRDYIAEAEQHATLDGFRRHVSERANSDVAALDNYVEGWCRIHPEGFADDGAPRDPPNAA